MFLHLHPPLSRCTFYTHIVTNNPVLSCSSPPFLLPASFFFFGIFRSSHAAGSSPRAPHFSRCEPGLSRASLTYISVRVSASFRVQGGQGTRANPELETDCASTQRKAPPSGSRRFPTLRCFFKVAPGSSCGFPRTVRETPPTAARKHKLRCALLPRILLCGFCTVGFATRRDRD